MKKSIFGLLACSFLVFQSCQNDGDSVNVDQNAKVILNTNSQNLSGRMNNDNLGIIGLVTGKTTGKSANETSSEFPMALLAEFNPPTYNGLTLKATHVDVKDNYVYVSYNTQGETYIGGIDVIDVSQPNNPQLIIQAILPNVDISTVVYDNGNLYLAGAMDVDKNANITTPSFVGKMPLQAGKLTTDYTSVSLRGNVATGLTVADSKYYGVSGDNGVVAKIDKATNTVEATIGVLDLRAIGRIDNKIVVLSGREGVKVFNADNLSSISSFSTSNDVSSAKRTIDFQGNNLLVSEGYQGLKVYNLDSGSLLQSLPLPTNLANVDAGDVVTNAVSVNGDFVYVANGAAGVSVYKNVNSSLSFLGSIQLGGSANYVKSVGDYIFVASGNGGLKIIRKISSGSPSLACDGFIAFPGSAYLNVNSGETFNYKGDQSLYTVNVNQNLNWCGVLAAAQGVTVNSNGVFSIKGGLYVGTTKNSSTLIVNGTLNIEGDLMVYGNVILNSGAKLQFLGAGGHMIITGTVTKNSGVTITGNYIDDRNQGKLK
ncbi:hypothetical protein [Flavobacterium sp. A45]|uniref:hypothetical protein n=1 Tax=Flavobacterium sp. A45 TaxID=1945862 RepID=UPI00098744F2|nr:hypothetical protein [Flavobacterium sp. A45]OOG77009.1 hypothetical protein B0E44_03420 [Flavobacterium sp. A45]